MVFGFSRVSTLVFTEIIFKLFSTISSTVFHPLVVNNLCLGVKPFLLPNLSSTIQVSNLPLF